jgi:hypothetical protein
MIRTFQLKVYMELGSYFLFLQEQIKDIIIIMTTGAAPELKPPHTIPAPTDENWTQTITQTPSDVQSRQAPALTNTCHDA